MQEENTQTMEPTERQIGLIIVNSIPHYCYEVNNILSLPKSFEYRLRYQKGITSDWLPTIDDPSSLEDSRALIVLRDWSTASFIPLRWVHIQNVHLVGDVVYFDFELRNLVDLKLNQPSQAYHYRMFNQYVERAVGDYENFPNTDLGNLVLFTKPSAEVYYSMEPDRNPDIKKWGDMVTVLGELDVYEDFDFYKLIGIESDRANAPTEDGKFHLTKGNEYTIRMFRRSFLNSTGDSSVSSAREVKIESGRGVKEIVSEQLVRGKYDIMEFKIQAIDNREPNRSFVIIRTERESENIDIPDIHVPFQMEYSIPRKLQIFSSLLVFAGGASILFFPDTVLFWTELSGNELQLVRNAAITLMILSAIRFPSIRSVLPRFI